MDMGNIFIRLNSLLVHPWMLGFMLLGFTGLTVWCLDWLIFRRRLQARLADRDDEAGP